MYLILFYFIDSFTSTCMCWYYIIFSHRSDVGKYFWSFLSQCKGRCSVSARLSFSFLRSVLTWLPHTHYCCHLHCCHPLHLVEAFFIFSGLKKDSKNYWKNVSLFNKLFICQSFLEQCTVTSNSLIMGFKNRNKCSIIMM